jgi:hypothetical protein
MKRRTTKQPKSNKVLAEALQSAGIENIGVSTTVIDGAVHSAEVLACESGTPLLSNPMDYIDELSRRSPFWGNVALRVLTNAIGWYAVNTILWDFRKRNMKPKFESGIDWLNDSIAEVKAKEASEANFEEQGHSKLQFVDGNKLVGAYKYLFMQVTASGDNGTFELPSPAALYEKMRQRGDARGDTLAAYDTFQMERLRNSPNFAYIEADLKRKQGQQDARAVRKAQDEIDHIHAELASVRHEVFTDDVWSRLPLWAQFKLTRSIHKQVISAINNEQEKPADERIHQDALNDLGEVVLLELENANRMPEVRLAFEEKVLDGERHSLIARK